MRASDRDRERVAAQLRDSYSHGLLSLATLDYRLESALAARTLEQLQRLVADLPRPATIWHRVTRRLRPAPARTHLIELPSSLANADQLVIGRSPDCDIVLDNPTVSRCHALLRRAPDGWAIIDLDSTNGTQVNDRPIIRAQLAPGQLAILGTERIALSLLA